MVIDMTFKQALTARTNRAINVVHRSVLRVSGGRLGARVMGMETVELHTTGRRSGQRRSVMLTAPVLDPSRVVLVTSKGGEVRHPDWYHNLIACPDVEITHRGTTTAMRAHTSDEIEKAELMPLIAAAYERYPRYQARDEDDVAVIVCEPR